MQKQANILEINWNQTGIEWRARFIVNQDYHNAHFSDRVWRDTRELSRRIKRNIESVVIQVKKPERVFKEIKKTNHHLHHRALRTVISLYLQ